MAEPYSTACHAEARSISLNKALMLFPLEVIHQNSGLKNGSIMNDQ
jgi:hypothetical protein